MLTSLKRTILATSLVIATLGTASADTVIRFATEAAYPPFNERAPDGSIIGWEIDLGMAMCAKMKRKCEFVAQDWDGMIPGLLSNRFDGIFASMAITPDRQKKINFTNKYYKTPARFVAKKGTKIDRSSPTLGGLKIGVIAGTTECYMKAHYPKVALQVYRSSEDMFLDVQNGRLNAIFSDAIQADFGLIRANPKKGYAFIGEPADDAKCFGAGIGIGVRKGDDKLREELNKAIEAVRADGTYKKLVDKYFGYDIYGK